MRPAWLPLLVVLAAAAPLAAAADPGCRLPAIGAAVARSDAPRVAREADRRLGWTLQSVEALREELRHGDFSASPRSNRQRRDLVGAVVRMSAFPWLETKRAACDCVAGSAAPPVCATLEADAERLRLALPRTPIRGPIDIERLTKGR
ncbi:MAG TPA: hypothetical protein VKB65_05140 [Myxococcota bacterium]|nr:hypothetical protein [Myxococcota bacterium]